MCRDITYKHVRTPIHGFSALPVLRAAALPPGIAVRPTTRVSSKRWLLGVFGVFWAQGCDSTGRFECGFMVV